MKDTLSKIVSNYNISGKFWRMRFETGWRDYAPGQFVMLQVPGNKAFLRRPFSIARMKGGVVEICYKVIGAGTEAMCALKVGEEVNVLGPLGNGFQISNVVAELALPKCVAQTFRSANSGRSKDLRYKVGRASSATTLKLLVAGGYGVAPLLGLAERICSGTLHLSAGSLAEGSTDSVHLFYGAKTKNELLYLDEFKELGIEFHIVTEDGSAGEKGLVTDILQRFLRTTNPERRTTLFACGPHGMLQRVAQDFSPAKRIGRTKVLRYESGLDCQLSLESYMGCGYGVCMGCAVKLANGEYARVCKEGPVFDARQLDM